MQFFIEPQRVATPLRKGAKAAKAAKVLTLKSSP